MSRSRLRAVLAAGLLVTGALLVALPSIRAAAGADLPDFTAGELRRVLQHGPWPPPAATDPSNRASGDPAAIALGQRLFFDGRLSVGGAVSCASCHDPARA
jgi:cytochrome c peroxidase